VLATVLELETGAGDEIARRRAHEYLASARERHHPSADVDGDPAWLVTGATLDLAGVHACAHCEVEVVQRITDPEPTPDRARWSVEKSQEAARRSSR